MAGMTVSEACQTSGIADFANLSEVDVTVGASNEVLIKSKASKVSLSHNNGSISD
jgi:hypothetical protein